MPRSIIPIFLLIAGFYTAHSQDDKFSTPIIEDTMTLDPEQNRLWREGLYPYSAKPKNMWELGISMGYAFISGDVEAAIPSGYGFGLHLRKALNYAFSIRFDGWYQRSRGFDARPQSWEVLRTERLYTQNINGISGYVNEKKDFHRNYRTSILAVSTEAVVNIGNLLFHRERNKWNIYALVGIGLNFPDCEIDLLDGNVIYDFNPVTEGIDLTKQADRKEVRKRLKDLLDGDRETQGGVEDKIIALRDKKTIIPHFTAGFGVSRKFSKRFNLGYEHQVLLSDNDLYDGFEYRTPGDRTTNLDIPHYGSIRLSFNLGNQSKRTEPLYWLNPISGAFGDLANVKSRPEFDLTDTDGDGVIDLVDQEISSPEGAPVDARGIILDSDGDGMSDYMDNEPYSPPGYDVDNMGIAVVPPRASDDIPEDIEDRVVDIINQKIVNMRTTWFLPMIHFDLDKYYIKPEFYATLYHVATVMQMHPDIKIVVKGHTDIRNPDPYNTVLSYRRAQAAVNYLMETYNLPRERFIIQYGGEDRPLVDGLPDSHNISKREEIQQYMNRRVEFLVASPSDFEMASPSGPDAGKNTPGSSRPGTKYSGNRNSGY